MKLQSGSKMVSSNTLIGIVLLSALASEFGMIIIAARINNIVIKRGFAKYIIELLTGGII